ncbi:hypothetical protein [Bacillus thuringiensis]|uniref:hypothetical protein n=1 Tax=Bacillus thuringiensis TaxID=1428 RepID=UPI000BFB4E9A|nr:hypothetical protein [Bacillus thuringiensis]PGT90103.1 hypothetical protein COD17_10155 [Bacillus thuringiensis]
MKSKHEIHSVIANGGTVILVADNMEVGASSLCSFARGYNDAMVFVAGQEETNNLYPSQENIPMHLMGNEVAGSYEKVLKTAQKGKYTAISTAICKREDFKTYMDMVVPKGIGGFLLLHTDMFYKVTQEDIEIPVRMSRSAKPSNMFTGFGNSLVLYLDACGKVEYFIDPVSPYRKPREA